MSDSSVTLIWRFQAEGAEAVKRDLEKIAGSAAGARTAAGRAPDFSPWQVGIKGLHSGFESLFGKVAKLGMMLGLGGIGGALIGAVGAMKSLDSEMLQLKIQLDLDDAGAKRLRDTFSDLAGTTGKPAAEIAHLALVTRQLGADFDRAVEMAPKLLLWGQQGLGIQNPDVMAEAWAGTEKITGGKMGGMQQLGVIRESQRASGMRPEMFMEVLARVSGAAATRGGMQGAEGLERLGAIFATIGPQFAQQPRKIQSALEQLIAIVRAPGDELGESFKGIAVDTKDAGTVFQSLVAAVSNNRNSLNDSKLVTDDLREILLGAVDSGADFNAFLRRIQGAGTGGIEKDLAAAAKSGGVTWAAMMEKIYAALEPGLKSLRGFLIEHADQIASLLGKLGSGFGRVIGWMAEHGNVVIAFFATFVTGKIVGALAGMAANLEKAGVNFGAFGGKAMGMLAPMASLTAATGIAAVALGVELGNALADLFGITDQIKASRAAGKHFEENIVRQQVYDRALAKYGSGSPEADAAFAAMMAGYRPTEAPRKGVAGAMFNLAGLGGPGERETIAGQWAAARLGPGATPQQQAAEQARILAQASAYEQKQTEITLDQKLTVTLDGVLTDTTVRQDGREQPANVTTAPVFEMG